jgi:hypothetical protein
VPQLAKAAGDFLLVGLHTDEDVEARRGPHTPIMNVHERALSVLACKYVDEVRFMPWKACADTSGPGALVRLKGGRCCRFVKAVVITFDMMAVTAEWS